MFSSVRTEQDFKGKKKNDLCFRTKNFLTVGSHPELTADFTECPPFLVTAESDRDISGQF